MVIDIINYTDKQLAALSAEKLLEVRETQLKKNRLQAELQERLKKEKQDLIDKGIYPSNVLGRIEAELTAEYEKQVEILRDSLVFYLHYVADDAPITIPDVPYEVDYSLSEEERVVAVKNYYETTYTNARDRYVAFLKDDFAKVYLGELYAPVHDYLYAE